MHRIVRAVRERAEAHAVLRAAEPGDRLHHLAHGDRDARADVHGALELRERHGRDGGADVGDVEEIANLASLARLGGLAAEQPIDDVRNEALPRFHRPVLVEDAAPGEAELRERRIRAQHVVERELRGGIEEARPCRGGLVQHGPEARVVLEARAETDEPLAPCMNESLGEVRARRDVGEVLRRVEVLAGHGVPGAMDARVGLRGCDDARGGRGVDEVGLVDRELARDRIEARRA